jgi:hypothetical protein
MERFRVNVAAITTLVLMASGTCAARAEETATREAERIAVIASDCTKDVAVTLRFDTTEADKLAASMRLHDLKATFPGVAARLTATAQRAGNLSDSAVEEVAVCLANLKNF